MYAKPGIAQDPLCCPIKLTGIDPETTIYIIRPPPNGATGGDSSGNVVEETVFSTPPIDTTTPQGM